MLEVGIIPNQFDLFGFGHGIGLLNKNSGIRADFPSSSTSCKQMGNTYEYSVSEALAC